MKIFNQIRTYFTSSLARLLIQNIQNKISTKDTISKKSCTLIVALSNLLNKNDCNLHLTKYIPKTTKIDLKNVDKLEYERAEEICANLKKVNPPVKLELLLSFVKNDYLKLVLPSMLSLAYKYPNIETQSLIAHLSKQPISVKKHAIRLAYHICPPKTLPTFYKRMWDSEKNSSIREVIFSRTFNLLTGKEGKDVRSITWSVVKSLIEDIDKKLINLCNYLSRCKDIETELLSEYCEISWKTLKKLPITNQIVVNSISTLASQFLSVSEYLDDQFCAKLFEQYLTDVTDFKQYDLQPFIIHYVMNAASIEQQQQHITDICQNFKPIIENYWDDKNQDLKFPYRAKVRTFVNKCCHYAIVSGLKIPPKNTLIMIREMLLTTLQKGAAFTMILNVNIAFEFNAAMDSEALNETSKDNIFNNKDVFEKLLVNFGSRLGKLWNDITTEYGIFVLPVFIECILIFINYFSDCDFIKICICKGLLNNPLCDKACLIVVLELIPKDYEKYSTIIEDIVNRGDISIKVLCDKKFELPSTIYKI